MEMDDKESIRYLVKRKGNRLTTEKVEFSQLTALSFDDNDGVCREDGVGGWYTYRLFRETFLDEPEAEEAGIAGDEYVVPDYTDSTDDNPPPEPVKAIIIDTDGTTNGSGQKPIEQVFSNPRAWITSGLVAALALLTVLFYDHNGAKGGEDIALMQMAIKNTLRDGDSLVVHGDHKGADLRFTEARNALLSRKEFSRAEVEEYADQYKKKADGLCNGVKTQFFVQLANQYYMHAAILSGTKPEVCQ